MRASEGYRAHIAKLLDQVAEIDAAQTSATLEQRLELMSEIAQFERLAVAAERDEQRQRAVPCEVEGCMRPRWASRWCIAHKPRLFAEVGTVRVGNPARVAARIADELRGSAEILAQAPLYPADVDRVVGRLKAEVQLLELLKESLARSAS